MTTLDNAGPLLETWLYVPKLRRGPVRGRAANGDERPHLWARWAVYNRLLDACAAGRSRPTQVVILEPRTD